jgi:hypothetical protein
MNIRWYYLIGLAILLYGCEKAIDFKLEESEPKIVIDATIENNQPPIVVLSKSLNYFSKISPSILANSFVHDAEVYISDNASTYKLKEYTVPGAAGYNLYYYSTDPSTSMFVGKLNTNYTLRILFEGKEYTASTTIPNITKRIDSMWWKPTPTQDTSRGMVMVKATDPPGFGDYVQYFTKRNSERFLPGFQSVYDDLVIDGTTYELEVDPGLDRNIDSYENDKRFFKRGDTVTLKLSNIDKATYDFWRTMEYTYSSVGNPFSSPVKVLNNISNGGLGYFGGYASQYRTVIIPK